MGQDSVAGVYVDVIKDVSKHLEQTFHEEGIDHVLSNLTQLWVTRLLNARVLGPETDARELMQLAQSVLTNPHPAASAYPLSAAPSTSSSAPNPYQMAHMNQQQQQHYPQGYQQGFPARPQPHQMVNPIAQNRGVPQPQHQIPHYPPQPGYEYPQEAYLNQQPYLPQQNRPTSAAQLPTIANLHRPENPSAAGRPRPNLARPQTNYPAQYPNQGQYNLPQNDGAEEEISTKEADEFLQQQVERIEEESAVIEFEVPEKLSRKGRRSAKKIPQVDGEGDDDDDDPEEGGESEQENEGGNEESLNSSLDSDDDAYPEETRDLVVCLFEKVTRARTKWRCVLKDGIMNLNGKDYLFHKNTGEFEW